MAAPVVSSFSSTQMTITWTALTGTATGNSDITGYKLYYDNASTTVNILLSNAVTTSYTITGLTGGNTYIFAVAATNIYGDSASLSTTVSQKASAVPDAPAVPTVATDSGTATSVRISWAAPTTNNEAITAYDIRLETSTAGTFV